MTDDVKRAVDGAIAELWLQLYFAANRTDKETYDYVRDELRRFGIVPRAWGKET